MTRTEIRDELEDLLHGECICDFITKSDMQKILDDVDAWLETAVNGDTYYYSGYEFCLEITYEIVVWQNGEVRDTGEPVYMTPTCSSTDLDAIKREVEHYNIESTGCIEIFEEGEDDAIWHYECGEWEKVE